MLLKCFISETVTAPTDSSVVFVVQESISAGTQYGRNILINGEIKVSSFKKKKKLMTHRADAAFI